MYLILRPSEISTNPSCVVLCHDSVYGDDQRPNHTRFGHCITNGVSEEVACSARVSSREFRSCIDQAIRGQLSSVSMLRFCWRNKCCNEPLPLSEQNPTEWSARKTPCNERRNNKRILISANGDSMYHLGKEQRRRVKQNIEMKLSHSPNKAIENSLRPPAKMRRSWLAVTNVFQNPREICFW